MSPEFRDYLLELLAPLEGVTARCMFGGGGLSLEAVRRRCPSCGKGELALRLSRYGPFVGCAHYPACGYRRRLPATGDEGYGGLAKTLVCPLQHGVIGRFVPRITVRTKNGCHGSRRRFCNLLFPRWSSVYFLDRTTSRPR